MSCLACSQPLAAVAHAEAKFDRCRSCGGVFIERAEFMNVLHAALGRRDIELLEHNDGTERRPCARCGDLMQIVWLEFLKIDECVSHGLWFDGGELERALRYEGMPIGSSSCTRGPGPEGSQVAGRCNAMFSARTKSPLPYARARSGRLEFRRARTLASGT